MDSQQQFQKITFSMKRQLVGYIQVEAPKMVVRKTLRFVDDNFREQGWQGSSFEPWKKNRRGGTTLVHRGHLRRSINSEPAGLGATRFYTNVKYAAIHNRGGTIDVPGRQSLVRHRTDRHGNLLNQAQIGTGPHLKRKSNLLVFAKGSHKQARETTVNIPGYRINMPKRQFAPYEGSESPVLNEAIIKGLTTDLENILNPK